MIYFCKATRSSYRVAFTKGLMLQFLIERWFDIALTLLFLGLEWYNHVKSEQSEKEMNDKLKKLQDQIELANQLAYNGEEEKLQDVKLF